MPVCALQQLVEVVRVLHDLYSRPKATYIHVTRELPPAAVVPLGLQESIVVSPEPRSSPGGSVATAGGVGGDAGQVDSGNVITGGGGGEGAAAAAARGADSRNDTASDANQSVSLWLYNCCSLLA